MRKYPEELVKEIPEFPGYLVTSTGQFINSVTGKRLIPHLGLANYGPNIGLVRDGVQYRRSAKLIVAKAFVPGRTVLFDTPIQLDGRPENLDSMNLEWRPRWFAWEYAHQFRVVHNWYNYGRLFDVVNNVEYDTIFQAAVDTGSLAKHIYETMGTDKSVFPGGERYVYI